MTKLIASRSLYALPTHLSFFYILAAHSLMNLAAVFAYWIRSGWLTEYHGIPIYSISYPVGYASIGAVFGSMCYPLLRAVHFANFQLRGCILLYLYCTAIVAVAEYLKPIGGIEIHPTFDASIGAAAACSVFVACSALRRSPGPDKTRCDITME